MAIINLAKESPLDVPIKLAEGQYVNRASVDCKLTVSDGRLQGVLPARSVFVAFAE